MENVSNQPLHIASFFSGIGGFDLAFEQAGGKIVFQCERDAFCQKVLQKHWPAVPLSKDITELNASDIPEADVMVWRVSVSRLVPCKSREAYGSGGQTKWIVRKICKLG